MKILADVGLVGLPNAGKSTLLTRLSAAQPKIAAYPFTTLEPHLGVLQFDALQPCIIADIPGLIEGAHEGAGLGHRFLKHIERTRLLLHVLDASRPLNEIIADQETIEDELRAFNETLLERRRLVVLNKVDLLTDPEQIEKIRLVFAEKGISVLAISALAGSGIDELKQYLAEILAKGFDG